MSSIHSPLQQASLSFTPALQGATDNPSPTYSVQVGRYIRFGKICFFTIHIVTTTMTKTTTADAIRISLPFTAKNTTNALWRIEARATNGTPVINANTARIDPNTAYLTLAQLPLTAALADVTYEAVTGIGVLTNTITFQASGLYEVA